MRVAKPEGLAAQAYEQVRSAIVKGELAAGAPLFEVHLAEKMGMSRTPVREALKVLARDGFVQNIPSRGYVVPQRSMEDIRELFELREALEGMAARYAAQRASDDELAGLQRLCDAYAEETDWQRWTKIGTRFHNALVAAAHNVRLSAILDSLTAQIVHSRLSALKSDESRRAAAIDEHRRIFTVVQARDGAQAEALAREHVRRSYNATVNSYQTRL